MNRLPFNNLFTARSLARGQAMFAVVLLVLGGSVIILHGISTPIAKEQAVVRNLGQSKQSFSASESGVEDVVHRLNNAVDVSSTEVLQVGDNSTATTDLTISGESATVRARGDEDNKIRLNDISLVKGVVIELGYGLHSGQGGISLQNSSRIIGDVYSNGPLTGANSNQVDGDAYSAEAGGLIDGINATGDAYANSVTNSTVSGDVYYSSSIAGTSVGGAPFPGSPDPPTIPLPISDSLIDEWKSIAEAGGVYGGTCPYVIKQVTTSIGPIKIPCDLNVEKSSTDLTIAGPVWVEGTFTTKNGPTIRVAASAGEKSYPIIADNPADRTNSSQVDLENASDFYGSGTPGSHLLIISQNKDAEDGGGIPAIEIKNSADGQVILYAGHGLLNIRNNTSLTQATAYRISMRNSSEVIYDPLLGSLLFDNASGSYSILEWRESE